jgi:hypothetical protein
LAVMRFTFLPTLLNATLSAQTLAFGQSSLISQHPKAKAHGAQA